jgi:hypothetical protein
MLGKYMVNPETNSKLLSFIVLVSFLYLIFYSINLNFFEKKFDYDEIDYINASKQGIYSNSFESGSLNIRQFIELAFLKSTSKKTGENKVLPPEDTDPFLLRHFHPPLPVYFWSTALNVLPKNINDDVKIKLSTLFLYLVFCYVFIATVQRITNEKTFNYQQLIFTGIFFTSPILLNSFLVLNFHIFHAIACMIFINTLVSYLSDNIVWNQYKLGISITILLMTLETGIIVIALSLIFIQLFKGSDALKFFDLVRIFITFILSLIALWPGVLWTGGPIKSLMMYVYRIFFQNNDEYSSLEKFNMLQMLIQQSPAFFFFLAMIYILFLKKYFAEWELIIPIMTGLFSLLFIANIAHFTTYFIPSLTLLAVCAASILRKNLR